MWASRMSASSSEEFDKASCLPDPSGTRTRDQSLIYVVTLCQTVPVGARGRHCMRPGSGVGGPRPLLVVPLLVAIPRISLTGSPCSWGSQETTPLLTVSRSSPPRINPLFPPLARTCPGTHHPPPHCHAGQPPYTATPQHTRPHIATSHKCSTPQHAAARRCTPTATQRTTRPTLHISAHSHTPSYTIPPSPPLTSTNAPHPPYPTSIPPRLMSATPRSR